MQPLPWPPCLVVIYGLTCRFLVNDNGPIMKSTTRKAQTSPPEEPRWQTCVRCQKPVHLNFVAYIDDDPAQPIHNDDDGGCPPIYGIIADAYATAVDFTSAAHVNGRKCDICHRVVRMADLVSKDEGGPTFTWHELYDVYTEDLPPRAAAPKVVACLGCMHRPFNFIDGR
jgi:hypothetical protein